jgi:glycine/D-amino acid oxidase-like deaminating enzyme/nitrite reductase/ring-hydroxylating ferredoxin subunit
MTTTAAISGKHTSFWLDSTPETNFPPLNETITVDVAIVGGGIAGLTAATLLKRQGKRVAVVEAERIVKGTSGHTTAKLTSLHQLIYAKLVKEFGKEKARIYGESNQAAVELVAKWVEEENIDCDFSRQDNYTFADTPDKLPKVEAEVEAAVKLGLPASLVTETSLPFPVAGAVKFSNQAQFHVRKYLLYLAQQIPGEGSYIFENSRVTNVEEKDPCEVVTQQGKVLATDVLVTTHLPILDAGLFFAKSYPKRSYIIGAYIDPKQAPTGMFIGFGEDYHSIRTTPHNGKTLLLVGGKGHKVGSMSNTEENYRQLEEYTLSQFDVPEINYRWSTQDYVSFDQKVPYIGKLTPMSHHIYTATGFSLWGMSKGTLAGMILSDLVLGVDNPWADFYDATRATPFVTQQSIQKNLEVGKSWFLDRLKGFGRDSFTDVGTGEGKLVNIDGGKYAAYRDDQGTLHAVSAVCPHLGCIVNWNSAEKSWDCPCHGSRFDCDGDILEAPAIHALKPYQA